MGARLSVCAGSDAGPNKEWKFERNHGPFKDRPLPAQHGNIRDEPWNINRNHGNFKDRPFQMPAQYYSLRDEPLDMNLLQLPVDVTPSLNEMDIQLVQQTWERASRLGTENVGKVVFMQIFKLAPGAIQLFPFKDDTPDNLYAVGSRLCQHATKVVATLATAVSLLHDLDTLAPVLVELGLRHLGYGVMKAHYDIVFEAVLASLAIALGERNTPAVKNSWIKVLQVVKTVMIPKEGVALDNDQKMKNNQITEANAKMMNSRVIWKSLDCAEREKLRTRLMDAAKSGDTVSLTCVLEENCDPDCRDEYGRTALHYAADLGHKEIVIALLKYGASPLAKVNPDECGLMPLHYAARRGHAEIVNLVFAAQAMTADNLWKKNPSEIAASHGFNDLAITLKNLGKKKLHQRLFKR